MIYELWRNVIFYDGPNFNRVVLRDDVIVIDPLLVNHPSLMVSEGWACSIPSPTRKLTYAKFTGDRRVA